MVTSLYFGGANALPTIAKYLAAGPTVYQYGVAALSLRNYYMYGEITDELTVTLISQPKG